MSGAAKKQLRQQMRQRLRALDAATVAAESARVCAQVAALPAFRGAQHVSVYLSMDRGELQTGELVRAARQAGKSVYVPRCDGPAMEMVPLGDGPIDALPRNSWGIPEPARTAAPVDPQLLDFIVVPGVAFDARGARCGHGRGYYDRYLASAPRAFACAVCLAGQVVDAVPVDPHDRTPDAIIAPAGQLYPPRDQEHGSFARPG
ncbi:hypothetical protein IWQ56_000368 [Coemansia nantahalensis]|uniref:Uncharacterized protein n=1 Tax=Coemansia nantahalensis TaxID=2789366 RepID=A0ACC1JPR1_9FUNG|nr:hypothetical protein IWQ57_004998 [Coemansia nantahalensis]KAJ2774892.1 hypothetical protein IWQ56_000368 [Coemansia nantahalensis]